MKTAVEWFVKQLPMGVKNSMMGEIEQAKEMEKEQICDAYYYGIDVDSWSVHKPYEAAEQYYKETYESNT